MQQSWRLIPIRGQSKAVELSSGPVTIGRNPDCTIPLLDERASRQHCVVACQGSGPPTVRDLNSRNGTRVNDRRVDGEMLLKPGDVIKVGSHEFLVEGGGSAPATAGPSEVVDALPLPDPIETIEQGGEPLSLDFDRPLNRSSEVGWMFELAGLTRALPPKDAPPESVRVVDSNNRPTDVLAGTTDGPNAIRGLLQLASRARATDIHVEPRREGAHVRMRVDGDMVPIIEIPKRVSELAFGVVKAACNMHVAGRDAVQDGHFSALFPDRRVDYRVSFTPTTQGQKLVVRVLDKRGAPGNLTDLGLAAYMEDRVRQVCGQDSGLLLVCGPTGSGKTTTLYNCLREIDRRSANVVTIEDPVEYELEDTTQIPVDEAKGNSFGGLLRSVLRQDPDVILVGEIRDEETARTAMQAALTGHLVFSTVHAKDTVASIFRLLDLKVEPYLVANSLNLVLAQRLVRVLCDTCKRQTAIPPGQAARMGRFLMGRNSAFVATGCVRCLRTGFRGRRAIFELLDVNDELRDLVLTNPSIVAMKKVIEQGLFTTLQQFGWRLVAEGVTTIDEVDRVAATG